MNEEHNLNCSLNLPYPEIEVSAPNLKYVHMLMPLYAGQFGELTAITQYMYQSVMLEQPHRAISDMIECVSVTEMHHFRILAKLICRLGGDPKLRIVLPPRKTLWWSGSFTDYRGGAADMLVEDIRDEQKAIMEYERILKYIQDDKIREIIERIIQDEEHHVEVFKALLNDMQS